VEHRLRTDATNQPPLTMNEVGDAIRESLAHGDLERTKVLLGSAGGKLKNSAELRFLERYWTRASSQPKP